MRMLLAGLAAMVGARALAQDEEESPPARPVTISLTPEASAAFNSGFNDVPGDVTIFRTGVRLAVGIPVKERSTFQVVYDGEYSNYDFNDATGFVAGTTEPFGDTFDHLVTFTFIRQASERLSWRAGAIIDSAYESGADVGESFTFGGLGMVTWRARDDLFIGIGGVVRTRLEDDVIAFPVPMIDWTINERWKLTTVDIPLGGALQYKASDQWTVSLDGRWEFREYRLDDDGPVPEGTVGDQRVPFTFGVAYVPQPGVQLGARVGVVLGSNYEIFDSGGDKLADVDGDPATYLVLEAKFSF